jgi:hypothetical protein
VIAILRFGNSYQNKRKKPRKIDEREELHTVIHQGNRNRKGRRVSLAEVSLPELTKEEKKP